MKTKKRRKFTNSNVQTLSNEMAILNKPLHKKPKYAQKPLLTNNLPILKTVLF